jgi:hypothetical protein
MGPEVVTRHTASYIITMMMMMMLFYAGWHRPLPDKLSSFFISSFRREVDEIRALIGYCAVYSGNSLQTFRDNLAVPSSRFKNSWPLT